MFKIGLLTSTAMTAVALVLSGAPTGAYAQTGMHAAERDANARFLCTYGDFAVTYYHSASYSLSNTYWTRVAVPVVGQGQTVSHIMVLEAPAKQTRRSLFLAGIYSNGPSGLPGKPIAHGRGHAGSSCRWVDIKIRPTTLQPNAKYWIEERPPTSNSNESAYLYWKASPKDPRRAYVQTHWKSCSSSGQHCSSSTSPWTEQSSGPYLKLR